MMKSIFKKFNDLSVKTKLIALFVLMSIIPIAILGTLSISLFARNMEENGNRNSRNYLEFIDYRLSEKITEIHKKALLFAYDDDVLRFCGKRKELEGEELREIERSVERGMIRLRVSQNAQGVMFINNDGTALEYLASDFPSVRKVEHSEYQILEERDIPLFDGWGLPMTVDGMRTLPYERIIISPETGNALARLVIFYKEHEFYDLFSDYEQSNDTRYFLLFRGRVAVSGDDESFGMSINERFGIDESDLSNKSGNLRMRNGALVNYRVNSEKHYTIIEEKQPNVYREMNRPTLMLMLEICGICIVVCFVLGSILSNGITKPIYQLIEKMGRQKQGPSAGTGISGNEIAIINASYDSVFQQLEAAINNYYEEQQKNKEAQIRALEFQINPHFLYNTLSTIIWLIDAGEAEKAIDITKELSEFFRISISKGKEYITIREEIRHVQLYIDIQRARYEGQIAVDFDIPERLMEYRTPKLVLQPLVENSIIHAMQTNRGRVCHIDIRAREDEDSIYLTVTDDGERTTPQRIEEMNRFLSEKDNSKFGKDFGIGISNVHNRIEMSYGVGYGLHYSREDGHTHAELKLRKTEEK